MFDIGFSELLLIGVVALVVIGPERLPKVARTAGHLFGRFQRYVSSVKEDISREMELDELRKAGRAFKDSVETAARDVEQKAREKEAEFDIRDETALKGKVMKTAGLTEEKAADHSKENAENSVAEHSPQATLDWNHPHTAETAQHSGADSSSTEEKA
jgi:sec-independent protein translocase protein TatB